jgi:succinate dehydrogenase / fumarate reductase flavoprotein subunit
MRMIDANRGVGPLKNGVYLDFRSAIDRLGKNVIEERYGNLFEMYERITDENPYEVPMRIYPAPHYTMGGLWVDYNLMTSIPGLYAIGEANFSDHGANRLGASALMQGLADGYFVLPYTIGQYLSQYLNTDPVATDDASFTDAEQAVKDRNQKFLDIGGTRSVDDFHRELGKVMIEYCGLARSAEGLEKAISEIQTIRNEFWTDLRVLGDAESLNQSLERAGRVADFLELAELMCRDALDREESCGGHFRVEHQTEDGEARRDDENFSFVSAWEWVDENTPQKRNAEPLEFEYVALTQRSYK